MANNNGTDLNLLTFPIKEECSPANINDEEIDKEVIKTEIDVFEGSEITNEIEVVGGSWFHHVYINENRNPDNSEERLLNENPDEISDTESEIKNLTLPAIVEQATTATNNLLPEKSAKVYEKVYSEFIDWKDKNKDSGFSENVLMVYFNELSKKFKSTTLWKQYSILKLMLPIKHKVDISKYPKLHALLKRKSKGYEPKKSKTFSTNEIQQFIRDAPDVKYLLCKVICIFGIMGACRRHELHQLKFIDVNDISSSLLVKIKETKMKTIRKFTVTGKYYEICKKYMNLRPKNCSTQAFFINYGNGKCTVQNVGINKFGNMGKEIATYLNLPNPDLYTGHCFRRSSTTMSVDASGDITSPKPHLRRKSTTAAENCIDESIQNKVNIGNQVLNSIKCSQTNNLIVINPLTSTMKSPNIATGLPEIPQSHFALDTIIISVSTCRTPTMANNNGTDLNLLTFPIKEECSPENMKVEVIDEEVIKTETDIFEGSVINDESEVVGGSWVQHNRCINEQPENETENRYLDNSADQLLNENSALDTIIKTVSTCRTQTMADNNENDLNLLTFPIKEECSPANVNIEEIDKEVTGTEIGVFEGSAINNGIQVVGGSWIHHNTHINEQPANETENRNLDNSAEQLLKENSEIVEQAATAANNLLPEKSAKVYEKVYSEFMDWKNKNGDSSFSENVLMVYFDELSKKFKSTTLWTQYSILKLMLSSKHKVDISTYPKLQALLKRNSKGYKPKKSKTFSTNEMKQFIREAPDVNYLLSKVVCIFGIMGACRRHELHKMEVMDVNDFGSTLLVTTRDTNVKTSREFTVSGKYYEICKKYMNLRPKNCTTPAFFLNYANGKCTVQNVGINKFGNMGKEIATYLNLPNSNLYTGHCFRRSSAKILVDACSDLTSTSVAENCIDKLIQNEVNVNNQILNSIECSQPNNLIDNPSISTMESPDIVTGLPGISQSHFETVEEATEATNNLLPEKSAKAYKTVYSEFMDWKNKNKESSFSEDVLMVYFDELSKKFKSTTLWKQYSILKSMLPITHKVDISTYPKLHALLKRKSEGYKPKKSKTFSTNEIKQFIKEAPDVEYLMSKVVCIFGIMGACRRHQLYKLEFMDVIDFRSTLLVTTKDTEIKTTRKFTVTGEYYEICKKYMDLRPKDCTTPAFFINYVNGKCSIQKVGITKFGDMGKKIATYLNLPNPDLYTGQCFRRSSATILVDADGDITALKRHSRWKSTTEAENDVDESIQNKANIGDEVLNSTEYCQTNNLIDNLSTSILESPTIPNELLGIPQSHFENVEQAARDANNLLPEKSAKAYEKIYSEFMDWKNKHTDSTFSENVLMVYFDELSKKFKSTTIWKQYSILKLMLPIKHNVDISTYPKLHALLKRQSEGYKPKKSKTFSTNEIKQFIREAPDVKYLLPKVVCIFGVMGACRRHELHKLEVMDVNDFRSTLLVTIKDTETKTTRRFTITGKYYEICKKYMNLRPKNCTTSAFFINYGNGKCTLQNVGINKFGNMGKKIATYLDLPNPDLYTGHCFRRSSATILVDAGGDIISRKHHSRWKSTTVAENYSDELIQNNSN